MTRLPQNEIPNPTSEQGAAFGWDFRLSQAEQVFMPVSRQRRPWSCSSMEEHRVVCPRVAGSPPVTAAKPETFSLGRGCLRPGASFFLILKNDSRISLLTANHFIA